MYYPSGHYEKENLKMDEKPDCNHSCNQSSGKTMTSILWASQKAE